MRVQRRSWYEYAVSARKNLAWHPVVAIAWPLAVIGLALVAMLYVGFGLDDWTKGIGVALLFGWILLLDETQRWVLRLLRLEKINRGLATRPRIAEWSAVLGLVWLGAAGGAAATSIWLTNSDNYDRAATAFKVAAAISYCVLVALTVVIASVRVSLRTRAKPIWSWISFGLGVAGIVLFVVEIL